MPAPSGTWQVLWSTMTLRQMRSSSSGMAALRPDECSHRRRTSIAPPELSTTHCNTEGASAAVAADNSFSQARCAGVRRSTRISIDPPHPSTGTRSRRLVRRAEAQDGGRLTSRREQALTSDVGFKAAAAHAAGVHTGQADHHRAERPIGRTARREQGRQRPRHVGCDHPLGQRDHLLQFVSHVSSRGKSASPVPLRQLSSLRFAVAFRRQTPATER